MQILRVLRTLESLGSVADPFIKSIQDVTHSPKPPASDQPLLALYEHARLSEVLQRDPAAVKVVEAFGLADAFLGRDLILKTLGRFRSDRPEDVAISETRRDLYIHF